MRPSRKDELLEKALKIFNRHGYTATGMDRLTAETGISKTTMYKYFGSKEDLILAVLKLRDERFYDWLFGLVDARTDKTVPTAVALFDALDTWFGSPDFNGCMFVKAAAEFLSPEDPIRLQAAHHKHRILHRLEEDLRSSHGEQARALAVQILFLKEGATLAAHMGFSDRPAYSAKRAAEALLCA